MCPQTLQLNHQEIARNISEALVDIIESFFLEKNNRRTLNVHIKVRSIENIYLFHDIVGITLKLIDSRIGIFLTNDQPIPIMDDIHYGILLVDSKESLEYLYSNILKYHLYVEGSYFIVLYTLPSPSQYYDELHTSFQVSLDAGISHANVIVYAGLNSILLFLVQPFSEFHCMANVPFINNRFINGLWSHRGFYVSKVSNLHGCPLVCATWEDMPYFEVVSNEAGSKPSFRGLEGHLLEYLAERMNFTVTIRWMNDDEINRTLYDERGMLHELFSTGTDLVIGAFHYKPTSFYDTYTPSTTYYLSTFYYVISAKTQPYTPFVKLLLPFRQEIWLLLIFILVIGYAVIFYVTQIDRQIKHLVLGRRRQPAVYNMLIISLGGPVATDPRVPFSRFLLIVWLWASFVLRNVYQGFMFNFLRHDMHKPPPTSIQQLKEQNYTLLMSESVYRSVEHFEGIPELTIVLNDSEVESFPMLNDLQSYGLSDKTAMLTAHEYYGYFRYRNTSNSDFYVVPEIFFTQRLSIYMMKDSIYLRRFNWYIDNYINEGHMNHWEKYLLFENTFRKLKTEEQPRAMSLVHLYGALNLLFICLMGCICVLMGEIVVHRISGWLKRRRRLLRRKRNRINIWTD
ncbi:uncharacterized protein [Musca autumnalis]|uniref:uncharacterized protein n=1 Tax=Musca autumnalis TaxID=221902 RepID=UPI003CECC671